MIKKQHLKSRPVCKVTFTLPESVEANSASVAGSFNDWDPNAHPLRRLRSGLWRTTIELEPGQTYQFRYLVDGETWYNDEDADGTVVNEYGSQNSVLET